MRVVMVRSHQFFHFFCEGSAARRIFFTVSSCLLSTEGLWFEFATDSGFFADRRFRGIVGQRERRKFGTVIQQCPIFGNHFFETSLGSWR